VQYRNQLIWKISMASTTACTLPLWRNVSFPALTVQTIEPLSDTSLRAQRHGCKTNHYGRSIRLMFVFVTWRTRIRGYRLFIFSSVMYIATSPPPFGASCSKSLRRDGVWLRSSLSQYCTCATSNQHTSLVQCLHLDTCFGIWLLDIYAALGRCIGIMRVVHAFASRRESVGKVSDCQISYLVYLKNQLNSFLCC
jgi:hypothetical protein